MVARRNFNLRNDIAALAAGGIGGGGPPGMTDAESTYVSSTFNSHSTWIASLAPQLIDEINVRSTQVSGLVSSHAALENIHSTWIASLAGQGMTLAESIYVASTFFMHSTWISSGFAFTTAVAANAAGSLSNVRNVHSTWINSIAGVAAGAVGSLGNLQNVHSTWIQSLNLNLVAEIAVRSTQVNDLVGSLTNIKNVHSIWINSIALNSDGGLTDVESTNLSTWIDSVYNVAIAGGGGGTASFSGFHSAPTYNPIIGLPGNLINGAPTPNGIVQRSLFFQPFMVVSTLTALGFVFGTGGTVGGVFKLGIYNWDVRSEMATTLIASAEQALTSNTTRFYDLDLASPVVLAPGAYALAWLVNTAGVQSFQNWSWYRDQHFQAVYMRANTPTSPGVYIASGFLRTDLIGQELVPPIPVATMTNTTATLAVAPSIATAATLKFNKA